MKRILLGFTYSMNRLAEVAKDSGVEIVLPRQAQFVADRMNLDVVDLPPFAYLSEATTALEKLIEEHRIDAFWPLAASAYNLEVITTVPVHAVCKPKTFQMINDKVTFANWLRGSMFRPEGVETVGAEKTMEEIRRRLDAGERVCVKPPRGVNGGGFWEITHNANLLADPLARQIDPDVFEIELAKFEHKEGMERFLVMEVLTGSELSIDALCIDGDLVKWMIREKDKSSMQVVRSDHEIMAHVRQVVKALGLHGLVSVQYMYDKHGNLKILEINLRPSGGCLAYGDYALGLAGTSDLLTDWLQYMAGMIGRGDIKPWEGEVRFDTQTTAVPV